MKTIYPTGTIIQVRCQTGPVFYRHLGIADGFGGVVHCDKDRGVVYDSTCEQFARGNRRITENKKLAKGGLSGAVAFQKAISREGASYDLFSHNCEHFVLWAFGKMAESKQLQKVGCTVAAATIAYKSENPLIQAVAVGGALGAAGTDDDESPGDGLVKGAIAGAVVYGGAKLLEAFLRSRN